jgi:PKD repeat protein
MFVLTGPVYGVDIYNLADDTVLFASFGANAGGRGIAQLPGSPLVWGATFRDIVSLRRIDNGRSPPYRVGAGWLPAQCLAMAGNGRVIYRTDARRIGLIGSRLLAVEPAAPVASFTITATGNPYELAFSSAGSSGGGSAIAGYAWSIDGAVVSLGSQFTRTFLDPGTHAVRLTITNVAGEVAVSTGSAVVPATPPPTFVLTVGNGTGSGSYPAGTVVAITSAPAPGQIFTGWRGAIVTDPAAGSTTLVMPAAATSVSATFSDGMGPGGSVAGEGSSGGCGIGTAVGLILVLLATCLRRNARHR